jgi:hypothetical protein
MTSTSKTFAASAAALFGAALFAATTFTVTTARADDYCITNGAQAAHGCGYQTMEACRAASAGIGGTCAQSASAKNSDNSQSKNSNDSLAYQPKSSRSGHRSQKEISAH